jgi:hypothetical protein
MAKYFKIRNTYISYCVFSEKLSNSQIWMQYCKSQTQWSDSKLKDLIKICGGCTNIHRLVSSFSKIKPATIRNGFTPICVLKQSSGADIQDLLPPGKVNRQYHLLEVSSVGDFLIFIARKTSRRFGVLH